jgi:hypothetical protein
MERGPQIRQNRRAGAQGHECEAKGFIEVVHVIFLGSASKNSLSERAEILATPARYSREIRSESSQNQMLIDPNTQRHGFDWVVWVKAFGQEVGPTGL